MMKFLIGLFRNRNDRGYNKIGHQDRPFFELSAKEKEKIIINAARQANKDQRDLVEKYHRVCRQGVNG